MEFYEVKYAIAFILALTPVLLYFLFWLSRVLKDETKADYTHTMWLNLISATMLNAFFIYFFLDSTQIVQVFFPG